MTPVESQRFERPRGVTFDVTGTLIHSPHLAEIYAEILSRHQIEVSAPRIAQLFPEVYRELTCGEPAFVDRYSTHPGGARGWWGDLVRRLCARLGAAEPSPFALSELYQRFERADAWRLYPDVPAALDLLRDAGFRLGVVSNWDERLPRLLDALELSSRFEAVVYSSAVGIAKPHPAIFHLALHRLGTEPRATLHIGDRRLEDYEGAHAAGLQALLLRRRSAADRTLETKVLELVTAAGRASTGSRP